MTQRLLLNVNEVASLLGCGRTYVYGMIQRGELPVVKLGRLTRIQVCALDEFIMNQAALQDGDLGLARVDLRTAAGRRRDHPLRRGDLSGSGPCRTLLTGSR
ncbi:MAG: helix-turn-helix domain-containing protein [Candidatus Dormibacteria bacterium]